MVRDEIDPRELDHAAAHYAANLKRMATTRCMACWVTRAHCMCARLRSLRVTTEKLDVLVAVHYKEYGKASNTAKLLPHLLAAGEATGGAVASGSCSLCVYPIEPLQERLRVAGPTLLLWPGEDSVPAAELRPWVAAQGRRVTLLVIDGSWGHARAMARCVPASVRRVSVSAHVSGPSLFSHNRRQPTPERVSTLEAVGLALTALGEAADMRPLLEALRLQVDVALAHHGEPAAFGHDTTPDPAAAALPHSPKMAAVVARPESCPLCQAMGTFKNVRFWPTAGAPPGSFSRIWRCRRCKGLFRRDEPPQAPQCPPRGHVAAPESPAAGIHDHVDMAAYHPLKGIHDPEEIEQLMRRWQQQQMLAGLI